MSYLLVHYLCLFAYSIVFLVCLSWSCVVCSVLPVSLDCPFLIALSMFSNVYIQLCLLHTLTYPSKFTVRTG
jgi:hypothetical protein